MRILIVIHSLHSGGAERVTANLSRTWTEQGWNVSVVTIASAEMDFFQLHPAVKRIALNLAGDSAGLFTAVLANARRLRVLRRVIQEEHPDIVLGMIASSTGGRYPGELCGRRWLQYLRHCSINTFVSVRV